MSTLHIDGYGSVGPAWFRFEVLTDISRERERQEALKAAGKFPATCADDTISETTKCAVLTEELGEVARVLCERECKPGCEAGCDAKLYEELVQVAAVATAWCEALKVQLALARQHKQALCQIQNAQ
jgi:NTP pyrophosphatase (non-canonical NTP hydrolase)